MKICKSATVVATCVLLTACGGGGGVPGTTPPAAISSGDAQSANPDATIGSAERAAASRPRFGSVTQSSNSDSVTGVTEDVASASFDGRHVSVNVRRTDGSSIAFNSESHGFADKSYDPVLSGYSFRSDRMLTSSDTSVTLSVVYTNWNNADPNDHLAGGYWMHAAGRINPADPAGRINPLEVTGVEIGAFVDGPEISGDPTLPGSGSATYTGVAGGFYGYKSASGGSDIGEFEGDASLTANFSGSSTTISGCIGCNGGLSVVGVSVSGSGQADFYSEDNIPMRLRMQPASVTGGGFTGTVTMDLDNPNVNVTSSSGSWGGRFSTKTQDGDPRLVAGTAGGEWKEADGSRGTTVGTWFGIRN